MSKRRKEKLQEILKLLSENKGKMSFGELYGKLAIKYGTTKQTFWSYLDALDSAGLIEVPAIINILTENKTEIKLVEKNEVLILKEMQQKGA
jgi:Fe2+ or Zn2+ uptake regulation protein